jgi:hypothetical protein
MFISFFWVFWLLLRVSCVLGGMRWRVCFIGVFVTGVISGEAMD